MLNTQVTTEQIESFLNGQNPKERIINITYKYQDNFVTLITRDINGQKHISTDKFYPFVWMQRDACRMLCNGDRGKVKLLMKEFGITVRALKTVSSDGTICERMKDGYEYIWRATGAMSYMRFLNFFEKCNFPLQQRPAEQGKTTPLDKWGERMFILPSPVEQYMIETGKRLFKGYSDYDELLRFTFDLETEGLNPKINRIKLIGIRTNKGYEHILKIEGLTKQEKDESEKKQIENFLKIIRTQSPDVILGYNSENFDWQFFITRCEVLGINFTSLSAKYFDGEGIKKSTKQRALKLGGEIEYYYPTNVPNYNVIDTLHAVRRAQAIDSNIKKADLKYIAGITKAKKPNRVYIPGDLIDKILIETDLHQYEFNNENGKWNKLAPGQVPQPGYEYASGEYIVYRYLLDDLYETDKVDLNFNQANFLICKMIPTTFPRACTMGTAGIWKLLMQAWSYENGLAIPSFRPKRRFVGGLSRLLKVGYVENVVKLDYNSLYPSIILTWMIHPELDISNVMLPMLKHMLNERKKYKNLKGKAGKEIDRLKKLLEQSESIQNEIIKWSKEKYANDKKQLPFKIFCNSFFGAFGACNLYPWGDSECAEQTTSTGRQSLRAMISWFKARGYEPIVGDTDGFNFKMPSKESLATRKYTAKGTNQNTKPGKEYFGVEADVAEFNETVLDPVNAIHNGVMGLDIDEYADKTINFSRKNYADKLSDGEIKLVGNTIKSKKMPGYIEKFMNKAIELLLNGQGKEFIDEYNTHLSKIYNFQIPLKDIASRGKVKKSLKEYKESIHEITKAGREKSKQAWYELMIENGITADIGSTIYYINTGKSKSTSDIKKITTKYIVFNEQEMLWNDKTKKEIVKASLPLEDKNKKWKDIDNNFKTSIINKYASEVQTRVTSELKCIMLPRESVESENDVFCDETTKYNVPKYIAKFNKAVKPLTVCFSKDIRDKILIDDPQKIQYFDASQTQMSCGEPFKPSDQDTYEELMTMDDKEIAFWIRHNLTPPFVDVIGMNWDNIKSDYERRIKEDEIIGVNKIKEEYNNIIEHLTDEEINKFISEDTLPAKLEKIVSIDPISSSFIDKKYGRKVGNVTDIVEAIENEEITED